MFNIPPEYTGPFSGQNQMLQDRGLLGSDIQEVTITDLIAEGPIEGLVHGEGSVYLDGDTLEDKERSVFHSPFVEAPEASQAYGEPSLISIPAASSNNGPVTCTHVDKAGTAAFFDNLDETFTRQAYRWLRVHSVVSSKVKIEHAYVYNQDDRSGEAFRSGEWAHMLITAVNDSNQEVDFFAQGHKSPVNHQINNNQNLKCNVRIRANSGAEVEGCIKQLYGSDFQTVDSTGQAKRADIKLFMFPMHLVEEDIFVSSSNEVYGEVFIDRIFKVDIKADSSTGKKSIYIPRQSNTLTVTSKKFSLSDEQNTASTTEVSINTPDKNKKYPGSSLEFRVGELHQQPLYQLSGVGVSSFPLTLSANDMEIFDTTNAYPTSVGANYPSESDITSGLSAGMVQKTIVLSNTVSGAQINEIDEIKIQFEFPSGHFATTNEGDDKPDGAAFNIKVQGSQTGGSNPTDWEDLTGATFDYWKKFSTKKTSVAYTVTIPVQTHLTLRDLRLRITRLTPNGQSMSSLVDAKPQGNFLVRGTTPSSDLAVVVNAVKIAQIICTINEKLSYPHTAVASVNFSSKSFPNPPKRAYLVRGLRVKIPSNYVPRHLSSTGVATYTGIWNGEFSDEGSTTNASNLVKDRYYTDNPAWVFYDILTNNRYGLGDYLRSTDINKFQLYKIAKYCDELVPAAGGGTEPRFTANLYLTKATAAYKVLKDMATIFRGILYWLDGEMLPVQDAPATPIYNFSEANIVEDSILTQTSAGRTRANQFTVLWNNPAAAYKLEPLVIEDRENILKVGHIIPSKATAFGCTSEGQAIRFGRWKAWTSINQTEIISFKTSINAAFLVPGDIINVQNESDTGITFSGRITASSNSTISLDRNVETASDLARVDGGREEAFSFGAGSDYAYTLSLLVTKRTVVLSQNESVQVTHSGTTYTYNQGDEVTYAKIGGTSTQLIGANDSDEQVRKNIGNIQDDSGNDIYVEFRNSTHVETKAFTSSNVGVVNGVTQITIGSAFSGTIPASTVWAIKEEYKGIKTAASYKEYKVLGIKEEKDGVFSIQGVEFYNSKFDAIDKDFSIVPEDPVRPPEGDFCPPPDSVYILQTPDFRSELEELTIQWEAPRNRDGTLFDSIAGFDVHIEPRLPDGTELIQIRDPEQQAVRLTGVPNGIYSFGVQTFTQYGKKSRIKWQSTEVNDKFAHSCSRTAEGIPEGIRANVKFSESGTTFSFKKASGVATETDWAIQSHGAPKTKVNNANQGTAATSSQVLTSMATGSGISTAFIYFSAAALTDYLKLATHTKLDFENTSLTFWQEYDQFITNSENVWTDCTNNADARVKLHKRSNKVEKSEGTTDFLNRFQIGDIIRVKTASNTYFAGRVAFIESADVLFTDVKLNTTDGDLTSVDEAKAIARNSLRTDPKNDAVIAKIDRSGGTYTHTAIRLITDTTLTGLRAIIPDLNISALNYNSAGALQNNATITLTATALAYDAPEFQVTGGGFSGVSSSADGSFGTTGVSGQTLTKTLHNGSSDIAMGDKSPLEFTVSVRESSDSSNTLSKTFRIIKVQDGSIGADGKTVTLDSDDYSIIYDEQGDSPSYTSSGSSNIVVTATARNFTDPLYRFTFDGGSAGAWTDTSGTSAATFTYNAPGGSTPSIPGSYDKANWPKVLLVEVGEKPDSYSSGDAPASVEATDSISFIGTKPGAGGVALSNSNHAHTYATPNSGAATGISISGTTLELIADGIAYTYIGKTNGTYGIASGQTHDNKEWYVESAAVVGNDLTIGGPTANNSNVVTIGNHTGQSGTDDSEVITYTCKYKQAGTIKTITTTQTLTKSKQGADSTVQGPKGDDGDDSTVPGPAGAIAPRTANGIVYNTSNTTAPDGGVTVTYSFTSNPPGLSGMTSGWSENPPTFNSTNNTIYYSKYTATEGITNNSRDGNAVGPSEVDFGAIQTGTSFTGLVTFHSGGSAGDGAFSTDGGTNFTTIDGARISTGSIVSASIEAGTIEADRLEISDRTIGGSTSALKLYTDALKIFDGGNLRVKIGNLSNTTDD